MLRGCFGCRVWGREGLGDQLESFSRVGTALLAALPGAWGVGVGRVRGQCGRWAAWRGRGGKLGSGRLPGSNVRWAGDFSSPPRPEEGQFSPLLISRDCFSPMNHFISSNYTMRKGEYNLYDNLQHIEAFQCVVQLVQRVRWGISFHFQRQASPPKDG